jgi:hypothetical protein
VARNSHFPHASTVQVRAPQEVRLGQFDVSLFEPQFTTNWQRLRTMSEFLGVYRKGLFNRF